MNKKIIALGMATLAGVSFLAGYTQTQQGFTQEQLDAASSAGYQEGLAKGKLTVSTPSDVVVDITTDNQAAIDSALGTFKTENPGWEVAPADLATLKDKAAKYDAGIVPTVTTGGVVVTDGISSESYSVELGGALGLLTVNHKDLKSLIDRKIEFMDEDYTVKESIIFSDEAVVCVNGVVGCDEEAEVPYLLLPEGSLQYQVEVASALDLSEISLDETLSLPFLGKDLLITSWEDGQVQYAQGEKFDIFTATSRTFTFDGKVFEVKAVYDDKVLITGEGATQVIDESSSEKLGDYSIYVSDVANDESNDWVSLRIAKEDAYKEIENGDEYKLDDRFVWVVGGHTLGLALNERLDEINDGALKVGDSFDFLGRFKVENAGFDEPIAYIAFDFAPRQFGLHDVQSFRIKTTADESLVLGEEELKEVFITENGTYYKDSEGDEQFVAEFPTLVNDEVEYEVTMAEGKIVVGDVVVSYTYDESHKKYILGSEYAKSEDSEITIGEYYISDKDTVKWLSADGVKVSTPHDKDEFSIELPSEEVKQEIVVSTY